MIERHERLGWLLFRNRVSIKMKIKTWATKCSTLLDKRTMTVDVLQRRSEGK